MIHSRFRLWAYLPAFFILLFTGILCIVFSLFFISSRNNQTIVVGTWIGSFFLICTWLVFVELRSKAIAVSLDSSSITITNFLGWGSARHFDFKEFDGFTTCLLPSEGGDYEYLYLMKDNKKVVKLSEFYHKNYFELKQHLAKKIKFMGNKEFSLWTELKEIFQ